MPGRLVRRAFSLRERRANKHVYSISWVPPIILESGMTQFDDQTEQPQVTTEEPVEHGPAGLTKERRQDIVKEFALRHGGHHNPLQFYEEVAADINHPARPWFEWDVDRAALAYNLERRRWCP
jgi:hypothetical protein